MMKKVLFTGGGHSEVPMIEAAKKMDYYVITTGNNREGQGHTIADEYVPGDFSDKEFIKNLALKKDVSGIVSGCNDFAYLSAAYATEELGLLGHDSFEVSSIIHTKNRFRETQKSLGIKTPKVCKCQTEDDCLNAIGEIGFPLLVKPVDLTGGKGVKKCIEQYEVIDAFKVAMELTRKDYIILEEYIDGTSHGISTIIRDKKVICYVVDNEQYGINKYLVQGACCPSDIPEYTVVSLIKDIEKIADYLELVDGLFHCQFIVTRESEPVMIDPCRRAPGDLYVLLAKYSSGVDYPSEIVRAELGLPLPEWYSISRNFVARECIMTSRKGYLKRVCIEPELEDYIVHRLISEEKGIYVEKPMLHKGGILLMQFESYEKMKDIVLRFPNLAWMDLERG